MGKTSLQHLLLVGCCVLASFTSGLSWESSLHAADPNAKVPNDREAIHIRIRQHLEAGEYGLARETAEQLPVEANGWLSAIARAQARDGAIEAARKTLRTMQSDREFAHVALSEEPASLSEASSAGASLHRSQLSRSSRSSPSTLGASGGGSLADFTSLINLITSTVSPDSWVDVGGPGAVSEFAGGVYIDAQGILRQWSREQLGKRSGSLESLREAEKWMTLRNQAARSDRSHSADDVNANLSASPLRKVSLPRLAREIQIRASLGEPPTESMLALAGLTQIDYLLVYPDQHDLVIAGPAGAWKSDSEGTRFAVHADGSLRPTLCLADLLIAWENAHREKSQFGCSIDPVRERLAETREFLAKPTRLQPSTTPRWVTDIREHLGLQQVTVRGIDPRSHFARVMIEADYHMKLIGMGLAPSVVGVPSYLDSIDVELLPQSMEMIRWWFTLRNDCVSVNERADVYALNLPSIQLQGENEVMNGTGERFSTGGSSPLNQQFADRFTKHFPELSRLYPIYASLENICDLSIVATLATQLRLDERVGWDSSSWRTPAADGRDDSRHRVPQRVPSIVNHRVLKGRHVVVGVSGGVTVDSTQILRSLRAAPSPYPSEYYIRNRAEIKDDRSESWWWD